MKKHFFFSSFYFSPLTSRNRSRFRGYALSDGKHPSDQGRICARIFHPGLSSTLFFFLILITGSFDRLVNVLSLVKRVAPEAFTPPGSYNLETLFPARLPLPGCGPTLWSRRVFQERQDNRTTWRFARLKITCKLRDCSQSLRLNEIKFKITLYTFSP